MNQSEPELKTCSWFPVRENSNGCPVQEDSSRHQAQKYTGNRYQVQQYVQVVPSVGK